MRKPKPPIPLWAKTGKLIWVEVRDKQELEVLEFLEGIITEINHDSKHLRVKYLSSDSEKDARGDRIHERLDSHAVVNDLSDIPILNDAELLKHLEVRYKKDLIHCYCGPTLVVTNPYKYIDHESNDELRDNIMTALKERRLPETPPHIWSISAFCYQNLFDLERNQAVCISGESGAGKTESTKRCLEFIANLKHESKSLSKVPVEDKILSCNPLLEAFGNAKTFRNDNSSRFGKYTVLYIHKVKKTVRGASIENYLLEKSRITALAKDERNYHIFYALCKFAPKEQLKKYKLLNDDGICNMSKFNYLNQSAIYETPKINDEEFYDDVIKSFRDLDFTPEQIDGIWRILAAVLYMGNFKVDESNYEEGSKGCKIIRDEAWNNVVELLEIDEDLFEEALTHKKLKVNTMITKSPLSPSHTKNNIDSISRDFYNKMFNWIVIKLNKTLLPDDPNDPNFMTIGVLDIFGFEIFEKNSIEQFFINFANEKLQGLYIEYIFENEKKVFNEEGLSEFTKLIHFTDNKPILLACDNTRMPPGIFDLVDQICALNKTDEHLHNEIMKSHKTSELITFPKYAKNLSFNLKHTARTVNYLTNNFIEKNKDDISVFLLDSIQTSKKVVVQIFNNDFGEDNSDKSIEVKKKNPKEKFLGYKFRKDMNNLINELSKCYCHFVRCIKPNEFKRSNYWNAQLALMQIRYMGLLDSLNVRKKSYPYRFEYGKFFEIYQDIDVGELGSKSYLVLQQENADFKKLSNELLGCCGVEFTEKDVLNGKTKIFLNEKFKLLLDKALEVKQMEKKRCLKIIETLYMTYNKQTAVKKFFKKEAKSITISRDLLKSWTAKIDGMRFKNFLLVTRRLQGKFRILRMKRQKRFKAYNMKLITQYLGLYKFTKVNFYILHHKRKVLLMQAMLDRKIKDAKNKYCRSIVKRIFNNAWGNIKKEIVYFSIIDIQRMFRSHLLRKRKYKEYVLLDKKIEHTKVFNSSSTIQRFIKGCLVRTRLNRLNRAASKVQGYFRMIWMRRYFVRLMKAIIIIQRFIRKNYIRKTKISDNMNKFLNNYQNYNENVAKLEHDILFSDKEHFTDLKNINNYVKLPFYYESNKQDFGKQNYKKFIPKIPKMELKPKAKFITVLIDLSIHVDTTNVYYNTWALEFMNFLQEIHNKNSRLLHLEVGESFTMALTDDKEIYTWGLNDYYQCARESPGFSVSQQVVRNLSVNGAKLLSAGKDHSLMVDEANNIFIWGKNSEGQLGLEHSRQTKAIHVLNNIDESIQMVSAKEGVNYVLTKQGTVFTWPIYNQGKHIFKPLEMIVPNKAKIVDIAVGNEFSIFLTNTGLLYSKGSNKSGQLGLGDNITRESLTLIRHLKDLNEKIVEVSCGFKHVICRTALSRMYSWGNNVNNQLGFADGRNRNLPTKISIPEYKGFRYKPRSVQAGMNTSFVLMEDRQVFFCGNRATEGHKNTLNFERLRIKVG